MTGAPPVRILLLEDDDADAALIVRELARAGVDAEIRRAGTGAEYRRVMHGDLPDLILSDNTLPGIDGREALRLARERAQGVPFIFVSGTLGEDAAVQTLRDGATDYVLKDHLRRLGPAVTRALEDVRLRAEIQEFRDQFRHAQKLEAMGQFAGTVAHDFRNILTTINGNLELLLMGFDVADPRRLRLQKILDAGQRGANLASQLLAFGRRDAASPVRFDPVAELARTEPLFRSVLTRRIEFSISAGQGVGHLRMDPGQFEQVLLNLLLNARDAMPEGGSLHLGIRARVLNLPRVLEASVARPGSYVEIEVRDSGCGMTDETKRRIFEPFFTTKPPGIGTGLGLASVFGIVREVGGHLEVESAVGSGSTFRILIPADAAEGAGRSPEIPAIGHRQLVLVVDDDAQFRSQVGELLALADFDVAMAADGAEAMDVAKRYGGQVQLLLSDLFMPRLGGRELAEWFAQAYPAARCLLMTGLTEVSGGEEPDQRIPLIRKPFSPHQLLERIHELVGAAG